MCWGKVNVSVARGGCDMRGVNFFTSQTMNDVQKKKKQLHDFEYFGGKQIGWFKNCINCELYCLKIN